MGKARRQSPVLQSVLRRRVHDTYGGSTPPPIDELIESLRVKYPEYRRHNRQQFTRMVRQTLGNKRKLSTLNSDDNDDVTSPSSSRRRIELQSDSSTNSEVNNSNSNNNMQFDLTKSMLRDNYIGSNIPKNVELELVTDKEMNKNDLAMEDDNNTVRAQNNGPMFKDFGGMESVLNELRDALLVPLLETDILPNVGVSPFGGILLHGPPGCGKTQLVRAIANETGLPFYETQAAELVSGISGESEENIRELFSKAYRTAPSIVFIDEIDAIASKRENLQREMEKRIVTQLMTCMDSKGKPGHVLVIGATNRPDALDPAIRRPGRFDREFALGVPDEKARTQILSVLTRNVKLEGALDAAKISKLTPGFVGADLSNLVTSSAYSAIRRTSTRRKLESRDTENSWRKPWTHEEKDNLRITVSDIQAAVKMVQPSTKREGFAVPNVKWEDVGGFDSLRKEFRKYIVRPIKYSDEYEASGVRSQTGFLLYGPPGCGKTLIAQAVANEAEANFMYIKGPELMSKYVGDSELAVRTMFGRARACAPCILFFDEVDALTTKRGTEGTRVVDSVVNQLLAELDGVDDRKGVYLIGATNRPEMMDRALLRPGRFGKLVNVPVPNQEQRGLILKALCRDMKLGADVDLMAIGRSEACANLSGADLSDLVNEAALTAMEEKIDKMEAAAHEGTPISSSQGGMPPTIEAVHFEQAMGKVRASVSYEDKQYYSEVAKHL